MAKTFFDLREAWETQKGIETKRKANTDVEEAAGKFTDKQIKMAYGIINDPRWKSGNMTSIVRRIEGIAKGLSKHPGVQKALKVTNEEVQVDEAKNHAAADELMAYAKKYGGMDKKDFMKAAGYLNNYRSSGSPRAVADLVKMVNDMDTDPRDKVLLTIKKHDPSMFKAVMKKAGLEMREEVELDEAAPKISTGKAKGSIKATGLRGKGMKKFDVDVAVKNGKFEFRISDESGKFQTVGIKQAARMLGESVEDLEAFALEETRKYTPPTKAEIEADKKKDRKADRAAGKARPSVTAKSITKRLYGR